MPNKIEIFADFFTFLKIFGRFFKKVQETLGFRQAEIEDSSLSRRRGNLKVKVDSCLRRNDRKGLGGWFNQRFFSHKDTKARRETKY